jgi:hypothetical protein
MCVARVGALPPVWRVIGIDFSGAVDAGKKNWIATCVVDGCTVCLEDLRRADSLLSSGSDGTRCLQALRELIAGSRATAFGLYFDFFPCLCCDLL